VAENAQGRPSASTIKARTAGHYDQWHVEAAQEGEDESWLIIYLDVITLLLVIFIVIMTMMDWGKGGTVRVGEYQGPDVELGGQVGQIVDGNEENDDPEHPLVLSLGMMGNAIAVTSVEGVLRLRISNEILFASGEAELTEQGLDVIADLAAILAPLEDTIAVEGHTDNIPIQTQRFPSNWELSTARATRVVRHLVDNAIAPGRLRATGYAETRPLVDNSTPQGRSLNRRVELILENSSRR
jgi:chemotaxis protein MotB